MSEKKKIDKSPNKKSTLRLKDKISKYRFHTLLVIGIVLIPIAAVFGTDIELYTDDNIVDRKFSSILISVKNSEEEVFDQMLEEMKDDPLDGLYDDEMPTAEDIFYSEWANDKFPEVDIPIIGAYIEEIGSEKIGDVNLDGESPNADLNISSSDYPSDISITQCLALWSSQNEHSFVSNKNMWFSASEGNIDNRNILKLSFNLTEFQLDLICNWLITGRDTWIRHLSREEIIVINPFLFYSTLIPGILLSGFSVYKLRSNIKNSISKRSNKLKTKKLKDVKSK